MNTFEELKQVLRTHYVVPADLGPDSALADFGLDSLTLAEMMFTVEDHFGVDLEAHELDVRTLGELVAIIDAHRARSAVDHALPRAA